MRLQVIGKTIFYESALMQGVVDEVRSTSASVRPFLITGETGTGKEMGITGRNTYKWTRQLQEKKKHKKTNFRVDGISRIADI